MDEIDLWFRRHYGPPAIAPKGPKRFLFARDGKFGYFDRSLKEVIEPVFPAFVGNGWDRKVGCLCTPFSEGFASVAYTDAARELLVEHLADESLAAIGRAMKEWGQGQPLFTYNVFIDKAGQVISQDIFSKVLSFSGGLAAVKKDEKWGFIDATGALVIPHGFDDVQSFSEGLAWATIVKRNLSGYIDANGNWAIIGRFEDGLSFSEGMAAVKIDSKWGYINRNGDVMVQPRFARAASFSEGLAAVHIGLDGKYVYDVPEIWGYINAQGIFEIEPQFGFVGHFAQGLAFAQVKPEEKYDGSLKGLIDRGGRYVVSPKFIDWLPFAEGLAPVKIFTERDRTGEWGAINARGDFVIDPIYTSVGSFINGLAEVSSSRRERYIEDDSMYIDLNGNCVWPV